MTTSNIIDFDTNPMTKLRNELKASQEETNQLRREITDTKRKISSLVSVNEMLKLSLADMLTTIQQQQHVMNQQFNQMIANISSLRNKLPVINSRLSGVRTQDRPLTPEDITSNHDNDPDDAT